MTKTILPLLALLAASAVACTHVDAGHVGVRVNSCSGGGVEQTPLAIGYYATGPCSNIVEFPTYQQNFVLAGENGINTTSSEGLPIGLDVSLSFLVVAARAPHVYEKYRKELDQIEVGYIRQAEREAIQETFAKYTAQQLYSDKKELARAEIQGLLTKKLAADGFEVIQFTINETRVPGQVMAAINAKVAMVQQAQQAEQEVRKAQAIGAQKVASAEADAKATRMKADAEAYANEKIASSLSPTLVQYKLAGKWNGELPNIQGGPGGGFLLNLTPGKQ